MGRGVEVRGQDPQHGRCDFLRWHAGSLVVSLSLGMELEDSSGGPTGDPQFLGVDCF